MVNLDLALHDPHFNIYPYLFEWTNKTCTQLDLLFSKLLFIFNVDTNSCSTVHVPKSRKKPSRYDSLDLKILENVRLHFTCIVHSLGVKYISKDKRELAKVDYS